MAGWSGPTGRVGRSGPAAAAGAGCACVVRAMVTPWSRLTSQQSTLITDLQPMHVCNLYRFATNAGSCTMGPHERAGTPGAGPADRPDAGQRPGQLPLRATPAHRRHQPGTLTLQTEGNKDGVPSARQPARGAGAHPDTSPPTRASVLRVRSAPRIGPGPIRGDRTPG